MRSGPIQNYVLYSKKTDSVRNYASTSNIDVFAFLSDSLF